MTQDWIELFSTAGPEEARCQAVTRRGDLHREEIVEKAYEEVVRLTRIDLIRANCMAEAATWIAESIGEPAPQALAARAMGHVLYLSGCYAPALVQYEKALESYERLDRPIDVARTASGALQVLLYLGDQERALALAERAREIFERHGDRLRLARLECNVANIYLRQDHFEKALAMHRHAAEELRVVGTGEDVAITLRNMAVCLISVGRFAEALEVHAETREYCVRNDLPQLVAETDYNIAYLYFQRGEYTRAIELYEQTRTLCVGLGDPYHQALCDLDQAEIYLELNLVEEGRDLARLAYDSFRLLEMSYEAAKALAFQAIAASKQRRAEQALRWFDQSRELFVQQKNHLWPELIDLYKAILFYDLGDDSAARVLAERSSALFKRKGQTGKAALSGLLLARIDLRQGAIASARLRCLEALHSVEAADLPELTFQALFVLGEIEERVGDVTEALRQYEKAHHKLEDLRGQLGREELKIAFIENKLAVYESLVWLSLGTGGLARRRVFDFVEKSKSRNLADLIAFRATALPPGSQSDHDTVAVVELRQRLSVIYRQIEREELRQEADSNSTNQRLLNEARDHERSLTRALADIRTRDREYSSLREGTSGDLDAILAAIPPDARLVEYYEARGTLMALVAGGPELEIVPLGATAAAYEQFRLLQFQLSKFRLGSNYATHFADVLRSSTRAHLAALYRQLIAPIHHLLEARHLIIVPHSFLHCVPFHALGNGDRYLIDDFSVSYAPSASVYQLCATKPVGTARGALVIGVPDPRAPEIDEEARRVAATLPAATLSVTTEGQEKLLRTIGPQARFIHIAAHGLFREDNPLFSSVVLGDSHLSLFDLYDLDLSAELVTLSGCGTGINAVRGGDELIGLVRGFLYAGAKAVLVSLWDVHDETTAILMETFYREMLEAPNKAQALRKAMLLLRDSHPHPYFWAPFVMIGQVF